MIPILKSIWREIVTPSKLDEPPYYIMLIAVGHALLGASFAWVDFGVVLVGIRILVPAVYWLWKERADLRKGGNVADGILDAAFVALGTTYAGPWWWPPVILLLALITAVAFSMKRR